MFNPQDSTAVERGFEHQLDDLKVITLEGESWSARDLMLYAGYSAWRNWMKAIDRAIASVNASGLNAADHFVGVSKMIEVGKGARREVEDVELTRYACYILFQNADGSKPEVALAQQYFAIQTRQQEVAAAPAEKSLEQRALELMGELSAKVEEQGAELLEIRPLASQARTFNKAKGNRGRQAFARDIVNWAVYEGYHVTQPQVYRFMAEKLKLFIQGKRSDHGHAQSEAIRAGLADTISGTNEDNGHAYQQGVLTPKGVEFAQRRIKAYVIEHGHLELPKKGIAA